MEFEIQREQGTLQEGPDRSALQSGARHCFQTLIPAINVQGQVSDCIERGSQGREIFSWFTLHLLDLVV